MKDRDLAGDGGKAARLGRAVWQRPCPLPGEPASRCLPVPADCPSPGTINKVWVGYTGGSWWAGGYLRQVLQEVSECSGKNRGCYGGRQSDQGEATTGRGICVRGNRGSGGDLEADVADKFTGRKAALALLLQPAYCKRNCLYTIEDNNCELQSEMHKL